MNRSKINAFLGLARLLPAIGLLGGLCGCGPKRAEPGPQGIQVGLVFDSGGRGDKSFNDSAYAGLERASKDFGFTPHTVDSKAESDYESNLEALSEQGMKVVIAVGGSMADALEKVAPNHPDIKYAIVDASVKAPNVRSLLFKAEEGSFMAGYLAGLMTKTDKIGFVGGMELPLIKNFSVGYEAGAKTANPRVDLLPEKYTGDWNNADMAKDAAKVLFGSGADIVYHAAGRAGLGVIQAAKEEGKYAIGVDSDQDYIAPGVVLTSMVKHVDEAVYQAIRDAKEGKFTPGDIVYDLKMGGVGLSPMTYTKSKIGQANLAKLDAVKAQIVSGRIKVPATEDDLRGYLAALK